ncbi:MAG: helix-turn-helix domain-containing protein [Planctomycetaceae bacterium]
MNVTLFHNFQHNLKLLLEHADRSHAAVAEQAGVSAVHLSNVIRGQQTNPKIETCEELAIAAGIADFGLTSDAIFYSPQRFARIVKENLQPTA